MEDDQIIALTQRATPPPLKRQVTMRRVWQSCCCAGGTERQMVVYFGQMFFSIIILTFSFIQLIRANGNCDKSSPYIGLISFLMGKLLATIVDSNAQAQ
jgi:hypothetical protein